MVHKYIHIINIYQLSFVFLVKSKFSLIKQITHHCILFSYLKITLTYIDIHISINSENI